MNVSVYNIIFYKHDDDGNPKVDSNGNTIKYELKYDCLSTISDDVFDWVKNDDIQPIKQESEVE